MERHQPDLSFAYSLLSGRENPLTSGADLRVCIFAPEWLCCIRKRNALNTRTLSTSSTAESSTRDLGPPVNQRSLAALPCRFRVYIFLRIFLRSLRICYSRKGGVRAEGEVCVHKMVFTCFAYFWGYFSHSAYSAYSAYHAYSAYSVYFYVLCLHLTILMHLFYRVSSV
jgi:hypothetical protein